jgi:hypothetical protein
VKRDAEETRRRIRSAIVDFEDMFTVEGVRRSVVRITGSAPLIIESADVDPNSLDCPDSDLYRRLYGENPHRFFILLEEGAFRSRAEIDRFILKMEGLIPADTEFELILLRRRIQLDGHCYLGLNSYVGGFETAVVNESAAIQYDTTIGGETDGT